MPGSAMDPAQRARTSPADRREDGRRWTTGPASGPEWVPGQPTARPDLSTQSTVREGAVPPRVPERGFFGSTLDVVASLSFPLSRMDSLPGPDRQGLAVARVSSLGALHHRAGAGVGRAAHVNNGAGRSSRPDRHGRPINSPRGRRTGSLGGARPSVSWITGRQRLRRRRPVPEHRPGYRSGRATGH